MILTADFFLLWNITNVHAKRRHTVQVKQI